MKGEILFEDVASDDFEPGSLGAAMARIVAKLLDKHNSAIAMFRDDMLFWNWAKYGSDEPILQAMSTATNTTASEAKHGMSKLALFNAGQGDCLAKHPLDVNLDSYLPGMYLHGEHPIGVASGEISDRHFIGDSNDLLAMGDFTTIPVDDGDEFWGRGFDPTQQFGFLDSDEDEMTTPVESLSRYSVLRPTTTTSSRSESSATYATCSTHSSSSFLGKKTQVKTTVPVSESEQNSVKQKINKREDTWHPTWIEDLLRECPDAEVPPIFSDNSLKMANSFKATGARPKERRMDSSAGNRGSSTASSNYQLGNMHKGASQQQESATVHESFQSEMPAEWPWPWRLGSNGELTTIGPWSPLRDEDRLPPPAARSAYIEAIRTELEAEIDELLFNLYEIAQPWFQEGSTACAENKDMWSSQQPGMSSSSETGSSIPKPNIGLALPSLAASMPVGFSPENLPLSATIRPPGFVIPTLNFKPQAAQQNSLASSAHSDASERNHFEPSKYSNKYPASNGTADAKPLSSTNPCVPTTLSHIPTVNTAVIGATEKVTHNMAPAHTLEHSSSGIMPANSAALATKISASKGVEPSGTSGASDKNPPEPNPVNCSAEVSITTIHDSPVPSKIVKGGPTSTVPDSTAAEETSLPVTSSLQSIPAFKASSYAPMSSDSSTSSQADCAALPVHAGNTWKRQVPLIYTSQSYALEFSSSQQRSLPQSASLPNTSLANNSQGTNSDATASAVSSKSSSNILSKPSVNISHPYMSEKPFAQTLPPDFSLTTAGAQSSKPAVSGSSSCATSITHPRLHNTTITATFTNCSAPPPLFTSPGNIGSSACTTSISRPLLHNTTVAATFTNCSAKPPLSTSLGNISSSACATSISHPPPRNTTMTATFTNCSAPPPLLSTSLGNISFGEIPWTFPWLPSNPGHQALSRPPAWHQHGPTPWATHGPRAAPINCNLPGHGNCTLPGHIRVPPPPITRPPVCTSVNPHPLQLGPGPVPRPPWPTSWDPSWPGHGQMTWPSSTWLLPPPENRSPQASISGPLARPMQCTLPPAPWTGLPPTNTQPTSVCGMLGSPSFGQMLRPPHIRPPIVAGNCSYQGQALAGTKTPPKPMIDSLLNIWQRLPPPVATFPAAPQPGLLNITSIATALPTASIAASPSLPVLPRSTAVPVTGSIAGPAQRHLAVPPPRHAPKVVQGRSFKPPVGASPKITSINPPPRLPPRLAPRLAAKPPTQPANTLNSESSPDKSDMPETNRPLSQSCKNASQPVPEGASRQPIKNSKDPSETIPEISGRQPTKPCKDTSQAASVPSGRQAITGSPMSYDGKALTKTESTGHVAKGGSSRSSCSGPTGQCLPWRKAPNFKSSPGVSSHSMHNNEQNTTAPALPEKRRQETFSAAPPYSSGRRKRRR